MTAGNFDSGCKLKRSIEFKTGWRWFSNLLSVMKSINMREEKARNVYRGR